VIAIKNITRGYVEFEHQGRTAIIEGEGLLRGHGSPDFVLYSNTFNQWEAPHAAETISDETKQTLLADLLKAFAERGMTAEIE
jgi:hypothetical protein